MKVFLKVREFPNQREKRFAPTSANTPPYRDETAKGLAPVPGVSAKMGVYSLAGSASSLFQVEPTSHGPHEPNGRRLTTSYLTTTPPRIAG